MTTSPPPPINSAMCACSCHPTPGVADKHSDGGKCSCEMTPEEKLERRRKALADFEEISAEWREQYRKEEERLLAIFTNAGVTVTDYIAAAPFVVAGVMQGCGFYLRERWDTWVVVAEKYPWSGQDVWKNRDVPTEVVAEGIRNHGSDRELAEEVIIHLQDYLIRATCSHTLGGRFCPDCGEKLKNPT